MTALLSRDIIINHSMFFGRAKIDSVHQQDAEQRDEKVTRHEKGQRDSQPDQAVLYRLEGRVRGQHINSFRE